MRDRKTVAQNIADEKAVIEQANRNIRALTLELVQISDDEYQYEEKEETWYKQKSNGRGRRPTKVGETHMVGRRHWKEDFVDEDTGNVISIDRSEIVRIDGVWKI
jgi:hypothetical protein